MMLPGKRCLVALFVTVAAGPAGAQPPEKTKVYDFSGDGLEAEIVKPEGTMVVSGPAGMPAWDPRTGPARIAELERALAGTGPDRADRADKHLGLARLLTAQAMSERLAALEAEVANDTTRDAARKRELAAAIARHRAAQTRAQDRAIAIYTEIMCEPTDRARGFDCAARAGLRGWAELDDALFELAYLLDTVRRGADALRVHRRLVAEHGGSPHVGYALLAMAERAFEEGRLADAEPLYARVLKSKPAGLHAYARYKSGWVQLNLGRDAEAFASFAAVIALAGADKRGAMLAREAGKDLVRAYAQFGTPADAHAVLAKAAPGNTLDLLERLGELWLDQGRADEAMAVFADAQRRAPGDVRACTWQNGVVRGALMLGRRAQLITEVERLVAAHRKLRATKGAPAEKVNRCAEDAAAVTADLAKVWHREAMKTRDPKQREDAARVYDLYLKAFPSAGDAPTMRFYRAELTWSRAESERDPAAATALWEQAAERYDEALRGNGLDDKLRRDAAYAAVLAWKNALSVDPRVAPPESGQGTEVAPRPLPPRERKMVAAFQTYAKTVKDPKDDELVQMKFLEARLYYQHDQLDLAIPLWEAILADHLDHEVAEYAANLLLDSFNRQRRYPEMLALVDHLLARPAFLSGKAELAATLQRIKRQGARRSAEQLAQDGKHEPCGVAYLDLYNADPNGPDAHEPLYNAGVCFQKAGSIGRAITTFQLVTQRHPRQAVAQNALARTGMMYAQIAHFADAAAAFERYAKLYGGEKDAADALSQAVLYYRAVGDHARAAAATEFFIKQYGRRRMAEAANAAFALADFHQQAGDLQGAALAYGRYLREWGGRGGTDRVIIAHARIGMVEWRRSCKLPRLHDSACVIAQRPRPATTGGGRTHCPSDAIRLVPGRRDVPLANRARYHLQTAVDLYRRAAMASPGADPAAEARRGALLNAVAGAEFHLADLDFEEYLRIPYPTGLDFEKNKDAAKKRFADWLTRKGTSLQSLIRADAGIEGKYHRIMSIDESRTEWALPAAARIAQTAHAFAAELLGAEIPVIVRKGELSAFKMDAFCREMATQSEPLQNLAATAYASALDLAGKWSTWNDWADLAARELERLRPGSAAQLEIHAPADRVAPITDVEPLARSLRAP